MVVGMVVVVIPVAYPKFVVMFCFTGKGCTLNSNGCAVAVTCLMTVFCRIYF
jgi:hypothetical protein